MSPIGSAPRSAAGLNSQERRYSVVLSSSYSACWAFWVTVKAVVALLTDRSFNTPHKDVVLVAGHTAVTMFSTSSMTLAPAANASPTTGMGFPPAPSSEPA